MPAHIIPFPQRKGSPTPKDAWLSVKDDFTLHLITQGCSKETVRSHVYNTALFATWCLQRQLPLISASRHHLELYIGEQLEAHARSTAMNRLLSCRSFYRYLIRIHRRTTDPTEQIPVKRDKRAAARPFTSSELRSLVHHATMSPHRELLSLVLMLIGSGCRREEIVLMDTDDIDWSRGRILVHGKGGKDRWVAPGRTAMEALQRYLAGRRGRVWNLSGHALYKMINALGTEASVVHTHPHRFRTTFGNGFMARQHDLPALKEILGHSDIHTTETYATWGIAEDALEMQANLDLAGSYTEPVMLRSIS